MATQIPPPNFAQEELQRALKEQTFGIVSFETVSNTALKATASVVLLEGHTILISLSDRGFQYQSTDISGGLQAEPEAVFESLEQLLQTVSPQYDAAQKSMLIAKLEFLQATIESTS